MNKIAIIDDNLIFRKVTSMHLQKLGFLTDDILVFENGQEIFDFIKHHINNIAQLPKTLFLDLNMPIMDGWDFLKQLQQLKIEHLYQPQIYIVTSSVDDKDYNDAMRSQSVHGFLVKPINAASLQGLLQKHNS
ncbi:response regulator [Bizionia sediminis]|uniref:Response regulator n=1 Tax=Bizionia sediminis TaxID=1737064 RepID=A0ABW5KNB3_9FLAO